VSGLTLTPEPGSGGPGGPDRSGAGSRSSGQTDRLGTRVGLDGVLGDLRRRGRRPWLRRGGMYGFGWDWPDTLTREWWPQGITTSQDSGTSRPAGASPVLLSGWYRREGTKNDAAVRVSVVDLGPDGGRGGPPAYEHVLLVTENDPENDPEADPDTDPETALDTDPETGAATGSATDPGTATRPARHRQVRVHAGGLIWWGDLLLVADTRAGLQVFDTRDVVRVPAGTADTHGCRYLLPRRSRWRAGHRDGVKPLRWSFCSLDRTDPAGLSLVAGEYSSSGRGARLARFAVPDGEPTLLESAELFPTNIPSMQGACRVRGKYVVSTSFGRFRRGHLWDGDAGGFRKHAGVLPVGPEDLSHDPRTDRVWTQSEYPGRRTVVSVPLPGGAARAG
jgi:hypothetical protein